MSVLTVRQREQVTLWVGASAWAFYNSERFPADSRFDLNAMTLGTDAEVKGLAAAILADACAVASALGKGSTGDKITIGPLTVTDSEPGDPVLLAQAQLWCAASRRLTDELASAQAGLSRLPVILAAGCQGADPRPVFTVPKISTPESLEAMPQTVGARRGRG